ncbi:hypothetical protein, partial [Methanobrevibacter sp.]|uniref:hypothetical protein n=1 Tax=Methanobrevibacter sp. TaxID=66852 RepID=UPI00388DF4A7
DVDGVYSVDVNGTIRDVAVADNLGNVTLSLAVGHYYANVTFDNGNYSTVVSNNEFEVYKALNNVKVSVNSVTYGRDSVIVVSADVDGVYTLDLNGDVTTIEVVNGTYSRSLRLGVGKYYANVTFDDGNYSTVVSNAVFEVYKAINNVKVIASSVTYGNSSVIVVVADVDGVYSVDVNGTIMDVAVVGNLGNVTLSLGAGHYYANVTFDDANYSAVVSNDVFDVYKAKNNVKVTVNNVKYGDKAVIHVVADVDGNYTLDVNGTIYNITVVKGKYTKSVRLGVGRYCANVTFADDANYTNIITNASFEVYKAVNNVYVFANSVTYGEKSVIIVAADVDGNYTVDVNGTYYTVVVDGQSGNVTLSLGAGHYYANVTYENENYSTIISNDVFEVYKAINNVKVTVNSVTYGNESVIVVSADVDGVYTLDLNGEITTIEVVNGSYSRSVRLGAGKYYANVTFEHENYSAVISNAVFEVYKAVNNVYVMIGGNMDSGEVVLEVAADVDGVYILDFNGDVNEILVENGTYSISLNLPAGKYYANVTFENENYTNDISNIEFEISKVVNNVKVITNSVIYGNETVIYVVADVDGVYTLDLNGDVTTIDVVNGTYSISLNLPAGKYYANVTFVNDYYSNIITNAVFEVYKAENNVKVSAKSVTYGKKSVIIVSADVDGVYTVDVNGTIYNVTVVNNKGRLALSLGAGKYYANVTFDNGNYSTMSTNAVFEVYKAVNNVYVIANSVTYGENAVIFVAADVDGVYTVDVNGTIMEVSVVNNMGNVTLSLGAGSYYANVTFDSENYTNIISNDVFEVYKAVNNVKVIANSVIYGDIVVLEVVADVDGNYTLDFNGDVSTIEVVNGKYSRSLSLGVGKYYANVTALDNGNYSSVVSNAVFEVYKAINNVKVNVKNVTYGKETVIVVSADVDGVYTLDFNGQISTINVVNGKYSKSLRLAAGKYYANVTFADDANYTNIITNAVFEVYKAVNNVKVNVKDVPYGQDVVLEVVADVDGVYILDLNGDVSTIEVVDGRYSISLHLGIGKYYANVTFDNGNYSNIITNAEFEVYKAINNVIVIAESVTYGEETVITVLADVDGVYVLDVNGNVTTISVVNGTCSISLSLDVGSYYANVSFSNPDYDSIISNATFKVLPVGDYDMTVVAAYGDDVYVYVLLPRTATGNVTMHVAGKDYTVEVNTGIALFTVPDLEHGYYNVTIHYGGDDHYVSKTSNITVYIKKVMIDAYDVKYGWAKSITYSVKLIDEYGNLVRDKEVMFSINGKTFKSVTNRNGIASVSLSLNIGTHSINITYRSENVTRNITVVSRFSGNKNINMYYFDGSKYTFKVYGNNGKLVGANQVVVIKLNKKTYKVKTDKNGVVKFTIPNTLKKFGKYTITATYKGQTIKNTIKVRQILTSKKTVKVKKTAKKLVVSAKLKKKLKGKKIIFKFKGKKYTTKTNKNGIAKLTIKKNVIKKLNKGKSYNLIIFYNKINIKTKIKVI